MDGSVAIERNLEALKRILAMLVGLAGLCSGGQFAFFPRKGALPQELVLAEKSGLYPPRALPRHLHLHLLRLLRPAEAAARRLLIAAARGLLVTMPQRAQAATPLRPFR